jgi:hypothetical protein
MAQFAEHFPQVPRIMEFGDLDRTLPCFDGKPLR